MTALQALRQDPYSFALLKNFAFAAAETDPGASIAEALAWIDRKGRTPDAVCAGLGIALPYIEQIARGKLGLSIYSSENLNEPKFLFAHQEAEDYIDAARQWINESPLSRVAREAMASACFLREDYTGCTQWLDRIRPTNDPRVDQARFTGPFFDDIEQSAYDFIASLGPLKLIVEPQDSPRVFVACDYDYFLRYGRPLINSYAQTNTAGLHYHVYDCRDEADVVQTLEPLSGRFSLSVEKSPSWAPKPIAHYYAAARLARLYQLLTVSPTATVMLDADLMAGNSLERVFSQLETQEVALCRMPGRLPYHTQINASVVGINPNDLTYLRRVVGFISKIFESNRVPWCLDQISLHCTLREMQRRERGPKAFAVGPTIYDGTFDCALWPQKVSEDSPLRPKYDAAISAFAVKHSQLKVT